MKFLMLESFFFITLGISCILLLMLIYHFKGRLSQLENNQQTLFEVVNNIVQELTEIKRIVAGNLAPMSSSSGNEKINVNFDDDDDIPELIINEDEYRDDNEHEDDEETDDDDSDDEDETEEDDEDEDEDDTEDEEDNSNQLVVEVDNIEEDVKVVSVDIDESLDEIEQKEEINYVDEEDDNLQEVELNSDEVENIKVNKLEETNNLEESESNSTNSSNGSVSRSVYKKMTVPALKALVIEKGLSTDPGKMKKSDLIELLDSNA